MTYPFSDPLEDCGVKEIVFLKSKNGYDMTLDLTLSYEKAVALSEILEHDEIKRKITRATMGRKRLRADGLVRSMTMRLIFNELAR